ncbi:hypothetical protein AB0B25_26360 [Nocardia sp. NPDC049190]
MHLNVLHRDVQSVEQLVKSRQIRLGESTAGFVIAPWRAQRAEADFQLL